MATITRMPGHYACIYRNHKIVKAGNGLWTIFTPSWGMLETQRNSLRLCIFAVNNRLDNA